MKYLFFLFVLFISAIALGNDYARGQMTPLEREKLPKPISLTGLCDDVVIVEWRASIDDEQDTQPTFKALKLIKEACQLATDNFIPFLKEKYPLYVIIGDIKDFETNICLIPDNRNPRNLNDMDYRFYYRPFKEEVWGYHHRSVNHIYMTNEVFHDTKENPIFIMVLVHELFHALSYNLGIYHQHLGDKDQTEEFLAEEFTKYLGVYAL